MTTFDQTPLDKLDPAEAWKPAPDDRWDLRWAAHLFRRAGFGVPPRAVGDETPAWELLQASVRGGREKTLAGLLAGAEGQADFHQLMDALGRRLTLADRVTSANRAPLVRLQGWWLYRMLNTPHPLRERMTLFWHNHFATSIAKVGSLRLMYQQNELLREHALGKFQPLLLAVSRNPAMIVWLDSASNVKGQPNENYAREIMELFSLGVGHDSQRNYTEQDIREAARAFTGWANNGEEFEFRRELHDDGEKAVLGRRGKLGGEDIVGILLEQPAAARFLVRKLFRELINDQVDPPAALLEPLAAEFRRSGYDVAGLLPRMLGSRLFFSAHAYRQKIKSPVDYVVGLVARLGGRVSTQELASAMDGLGQSLLEPPNVAGWKGGRTWLNSATLVARHNLAWRLLGSEDGQFADKLDPARAARQHAKADRAAAGDFLLQLLVEGDVTPEARARLMSLATAAQSKKDAKDSDASLRQLAHTIVLLPEYQLA
jgi:uncharacterized protein (DUF1800 family)